MPLSVGNGSNPQTNRVNEPGCQPTFDMEGIEPGFGVTQTV